jgi:hypothetical protein
MGDHLQGRAARAARPVIPPWLAVPMVGGPPPRGRRGRLPSIFVALIFFCLACTQLSAPPPVAPQAQPRVPVQDDAQITLQEFPVPPGSGPHDVAPAADGGVWYTAQGSGQLGLLDPATGGSKLIPLGRGSAPHGVIVGPDGAPWVTDGGQNAIERVDPVTDEVRVFPLNLNRNANLNTAALPPWPVATSPALTRRRERPRPSTRQRPTRAPAASGRTPAPGYG